MPLIDASPRSPLGLEREAYAVCIPLFGAHGLFVQCLRSVLRHTPVDVPIVVADDASPEPASRALVEGLESDGTLEHALYYVRQPTNVGFVRNCNDVFDAVAPADVLLVNSDCEVGPEWAERLREAAYSDSTIATASALTNHGTILSLPRRNHPVGHLPAGGSVDEIAVALQRRAQRVRPRIPTAIGHCMYVRRAALDLVGPFDPAFSPGYGEEVDFSQRCVVRGLSHVVADDVFVFHRGAGSFGDSPHQARNEAILSTRYPYYHAAVDAAAEDATGPLARTLAIGRIAMRGLSVTIDARCLGPYVTGTQLHTLELVVALARQGRFRLRVVVPPTIGRSARTTLAQLGNVDLVDLGEGRRRRLEPDDVVHRPFQVFHPSDLELLPELGERLVITHQDMIAYRNPAYFASPESWRQYRSVTRRAFAVADHVCFFSRHAADDAGAEQLIDPSRTSVVHLGVDHHALVGVPDAEAPAALASADSGPFLLCIGTDFRHKNRLFALEVFAELRRRHDWSGRLVFAGPKVKEGSSAPDEAEFLARHPDLGDRTHTLRGVTEAEKAWLFQNCAGVIYPSAYEGFGLVPFEAATYGVPCFFAWQSALREILPRSSALIVPWDAEQTAAAVLGVLSDEQQRRSVVGAVAAAGERFTWDRTAAELGDLYERVVTALPRDLTVSADHPDSGLTLPRDVSNALLAVTIRPWLREPFFWSLKAAFRVGRTVRRVSGASRSDEFV